VLTACGSPPTTAEQTQTAAAGAATIAAPSPTAGTPPTPSAVAGTPTPGSKGMTVGGFVWVNARPANSGIIVKALVDGIECASGRAVTWVDAYEPLVELTIPSAEQQAGCGTAGAKIRFVVDGSTANQEAVWEQGVHQSLQLVVGPEFARYQGTYAYPSVTGEPVRVEPIINGKVCGVDLAAGIGPAERRGYDVIVDPEAVSPGCGRPGANVVLRLAITEFGVTRVLAIARARVVWTPAKTTSPQISFDAQP